MLGLFVFRMALDALVHRYVAKVDRVLEWFTLFVTALTLSDSQTTEIYWMFESTSGRILFRGTCRIVDHRMTDTAVVTDHFPIFAAVLTIMTTETPG